MTAQVIQKGVEMPQPTAQDDKSMGEVEYCYKIYTVCNKLKTLWKIFQGVFLFAKKVAPYYSASIDILLLCPFHRGIYERKKNL